MTKTRKALLVALPTVALVIVGGAGIVARELRRTSDVPILVLTAKTATEDRIHCLELEVDDYSHVRNLRHKVEADHHHPRIIETVISAGYRLGLHADPNIPTATQPSHTTNTG